MRILRFSILSIQLFLMPQLLLASSIVITFGSLTDSELLTTQFPALVFSNAIALTAGISLNEIDFPPHSAVSVVGDDGGSHAGWKPCHTCVRPERRRQP